ncbi:MAG: hypothetical protein AB7O93_26915 [Vicinamibacterales bacterium]
MAGRKIVDELDARECLDAVRQSGLSRVAWARSAGVDARSLNSWRMNLERRSRPVDWLEIVPAVVPEAPLRVFVGRLSVEVSPGFDAETLRRLVQVLEAC